MAAKSDISVDNAQILIHDPSRRGLEALYRKASMPEALYGAVDGEPRDLERFRSRIITRVLTLVETVDPADADYLLDKLADVRVNTPANGTQGSQASSGAHALPG